MGNFNGKNTSCRAVFLYRSQHFIKLKCSRHLILTIQFTVKAHGYFGGEWESKRGNFSLLCCDGSRGLLAKCTAATYRGDATTVSNDINRKY